MTLWLLVTYCLLILLASVIGGSLPLMMRLTHTTVQALVSFVAGVMLGAGFVHMLPHALAQLGRPSTTMLWALAGFLLMFFIQRYLAVHQHLAPREQSASEHRCGASEAVHHHEHEDLPSSHSTGMFARQVSWTGLAVGLGLHSLLNGIALAASVEDARSAGVPWAGAAIFVAIAVHKPLDALTITTLMTSAGWSRVRCQTVNVLFALAVPLGVATFYAGMFSSEGSVLGASLAMSAGVFICIAASDLLPEMQFHSHDRNWLSAWLLAGVVLALVVEFL